MAAPNAMWNTICDASLVRSPQSASHHDFIAELDTATVIKLRHRDACNSLSEAGNGSDAAVRALVAGFKTLERWNYPTSHVTMWSEAISWSGGLRLPLPDVTCLHYPELLWRPEPTACWPACDSVELLSRHAAWDVPRCTPPRSSSLRRLERVVFLHLYDAYDSPGHSITQLMPQLALALDGASDEMVAATHVHTNQDIRRGWFREWVQLAGHPGIEQRLHQHHVVASSKTLLPSNGGAVSGHPLASTLLLLRARAWHNLRLLGRNELPCACACARRVLIVTRSGQTRRELSNGEEVTRVVRDVLIRRHSSRRAGATDDTGHANDEDDRSDGSGEERDSSGDAVIGGGSRAADTLTRRRRRAWRHVSVFNDSTSAFEHCESFREADLVIAAHGAALANLVCARPGTAVVELLAPVWTPPLRTTPQPNLVFMHLAWALGQTYYGMHVPGASYDGPMRVDTSHLRRVLARVELMAARAQTVESC